MAVRQYVGARYVPKFYEFNNGVWQSNTEYEPLTIVQYNNNSYTSKKSVPANIGNPSENTEYWAATGNYNAQVEHYRQEVEEVKLSKVTNLANRKFIFVADSYGVYGWTANVINRLNLNAHALNVSGAGFKGAGEGVTWQEALETWGNTLTSAERDTYTDIIVLGGINDIIQDISNIETAIDNFCASAFTLFPNVKIGCGCLSWCAKGNNVSLYINKVITTYEKKFSSKENCYYIPKMYLPLHDYSLIQSDGVHPTPEGTNAITNYICNWLLTGSADYIVQNNAIVTPISGVASGPIDLVCTMDSNGVDFHLNFSQGIELDTVKNLNDFNALLDIATISGGCVRGVIPENANGKASIVLSTSGFVSDANNVETTATFTIAIYSGYIAVSGISYDKSGASVLAKKLYPAPITAHVGLLSS